MMGINYDVLLTTAARPFLAYIVFLILVYPIKRLIFAILPDSKFKRLLFRRFDGSDRPADPQKVAERAAREHRSYSIGKNAAAVIRRRFRI